MPKLKNKERVENKRERKQDSIFLDVYFGILISLAAGGEQITKLTALLNKHCNALIQALIQFDVVEAFGRCICEHQESHVPKDALQRLLAAGS